MKLRIILAVMLATSAATAAPRRALLVGNHEGAPDQATLRYTGDDVRRLASTLRELGAVDANEMQDATADRVSARLDELAKGDKSDLFVFYYSGHADGSTLALGGTSLPLATVLAKVAAVPADLRIIVLDACQSGTATRSKGVTIAPPFDVSAHTDATGDVVITSSSASEASYESDASRAGVFSLHFATGLRGAADEDGDGAITIGEAYRYAYAQTLRATLLSGSGAQHPTFRYAVEGQREPVLTRLASSAHLTLRAAEEGSFVLFDDRETRVFAEVRLDKDKSQRLALAPGKYVVRKRGARELRTASIVLGQTDDRVLEESQMPSTPLIRLPPKGGLGDLAIGAAVGQYWGALGESGHFRLFVGPEWERGTWLFRAEAVLGVGIQRNADLETRQQTLGIAASALTGFRSGDFFLRAGPLVGAEVIRQQPTGRADLVAAGFRFGPRVRLDLALGRNLAIFGVLDVDLLVTKVEDRVALVGPFGLVPSVSWAAGFSTAW
jgi:uncharacterized caspase-like protein